MAYQAHQRISATKNNDRTRRAIRRLLRARGYERMNLAFDRDLGRWVVADAATDRWWAVANHDEVESSVREPGTRGLVFVEGRLE